MRFVEISYEPPRISGGNVGPKRRRRGITHMKRIFLLNLYKKISIKTKLMFIAAIFIIYPIAIIGYFGYTNYADTMKEKAIKDMQSMAHESSAVLSERMSKLSLFAVQLLYDHTIYDAQSNLISGRMDSFRENAFTKYLQSNLFLKSELNEMLVRFNKNQKIFQVNRSMGLSTDCYLHIDALYEAARAAGGSPVWYVAQEEGSVTGIFLTKTIYDIENIKNEIGLLVFKVNEEYLFEVLNNHVSHTNQNVTLFDNNGKAVYTHEAFKMNFTEAGEGFEDNSPTPFSSRINDENDTVYVFYNPVEPMHWWLATGISSNVLLKDVRRIARLMLILCAAMLPMCLLLVNYFYSDIIKPLNLLIKKMKQIERGAIGVEIESSRSDEFGYVYGTFNKMSQNIKTLINTVYKKQIAMKDAEIKALQAQINPHFLYNTLEAISWKAKINGVGEISDMVSALSYIIEANLNRKNEKFIPIYREIEYINKYNFLIRKRFGKKVDFAVNAGEDTLNHVIPKLMLQPIIENAVYHGLEMKKGGGRIEVSISRENETLLITVSDNGLGIEPDILARLKQSLAAEDPAEIDGPPAEGAKIGILNVHRRIKLLYGESYGLEISSEAGIGTTVKIKLPAAVRERSEGNVQGAHY